METPADKFPNSDEYGLVSYIKTALWLYLLEATVGRDKVDAALQNYFTKWKFKHPNQQICKPLLKKRSAVTWQNFSS
jgi:hypothetical protein